MSKTEGKKFLRSRESFNEFKTPQKPETEEGVDIEMRGAASDKADQAEENAMY